MKFKDIPKFTSFGNWEIDVSLAYLGKFVEQEINEPPYLDINPDFQRAHVWNDEKKVKYVEYLLRGGKSGRIIYCNCVGWNSSNAGPYVLVDGKQRLDALLKFINNELPIFGNNYLKDFDKLSHANCGIRWHINDLSTRKEVLQWYLDLNEGGVIHTKEELDKVRMLLEKE